MLNLKRPFCSKPVIRALNFHSQKLLSRLNRVQKKLPKHCQETGYAPFILPAQNRYCSLLIGHRTILRELKTIYRASVFLEFCFSHVSITLSESSGNFRFRASFWIPSKMAGTKARLWKWRKRSGDEKNGGKGGDSFFARHLHCILALQLRPITIKSKCVSSLPPSDVYKRELSDPKEKKQNIQMAEFVD